MYFSKILTEKLDEKFHNLQWFYVIFLNKQVSKFRICFQVNFKNTKKVKTLSVTTDVHKPDICYVTKHTNRQCEESIKKKTHLWQYCVLAKNEWYSESSSSANNKSTLTNFVTSNLIKINWTIAIICTSMHQNFDANLQQVDLHINASKLWRKSITGIYLLSGMDEMM